MLKKAICLVVMLCVSIMACGCNNDNSEIIGVVTPSKPNENEISFVKKPVSYSFPEFMLENDNISKFSHMVYRNFDIDKTNTPLETPEKTKGGYVCDLTFLNGRLKRFKYMDKFGLIDENDNVKLQGNYSSIRLVRPDLFELVGIDGKTVYATYNDNADIVFLTEENIQSFEWIFKKGSLTVTNVTSDSVDNSPEVTDVVKYSLKTPDGKIVFDKSFDSIVETIPEGLGMNIDAEYAYTAYSGEIYYFIIFDKFYNYSVYEGIYGNIDIQIGKNKGSCYILNHDHYVQILSLTASFDYKETDKEAKTDDYVFFDFSVSKFNQNKYLIYNNGYCEFTTLDENGEPVTKKYMVSKECFADAIDWVNINLSEDYENN